MPEVVNVASAFEIVELEGLQRRLRLVDRGLPYRPLNFKTNQRVNSTWLPGNPIATANLTGRTLPPSGINGFWKDKYVQTTVEAQTAGGLAAGSRANMIAPITVNGAAISSVMEAAKVVADICERGSLLEVTWDEIARHGYLRDFDESWHNRHDLEWQMSFEWVSRGEAQVPAVFTTEASLSDAAGVLSRLNEDLQAEVFPAPLALDLDYQTLVSVQLSLISGDVLQTQELISSVTDLATSPVDATRRMVAIATSLVVDSSELVRLFEATPAGAADVETPLGEQTFGRRMVAEAWTRRGRRRARAVRAAAVSRRDAFTRVIRRDLIAIVSARSGEDLREISIRHYGTPFEWRRLMVFNELNSPVLARGRRILVPRISGPIISGAC